MSERETADTISESALRWVAWADRGLSAAERATLEAWLAGDSRRRGAYLRAQAAWAMLDRASVLGAGDEPLPDMASPGIDRRRVLAGGALAVASIAAGGAWLMLPPAPVQIATATGEIRRVPLADGSLAAVNTQTKLAVALEPHLRRVELAEGEAWFQVAKDRARPFVVAAGDVRVRAVGTAFSVRRRDDGVDILVTEGVVEAWHEHDDSAPPVRVAAGARAFLPDAPAARAAPPAVVAASVEIERRLAWRSGQIMLDGDTLGEAVAEFNRYNDRRLVIGDASLAGERLVGRFRTNEPDAFARAAARTLGARVEASENEIRIGGS